MMSARRGRERREADADEDGSGEPHSSRLNEGMRPCFRAVRLHRGPGFSCRHCLLFEFRVLGFFGISSGQVRVQWRWLRAYGGASDTGGSFLQSGMSRYQDIPSRMSG